MKMSLLAIIVSGIFICFMTIIYCDTQAESNSVAIEKQYKSYVMSACDAAIGEALNNNQMEDNRLFASCETRKRAVSAFFRSLMLSFNRTEVSVNELIAYVPVILLIDNDGLYIWSDNVTSDNITDYDFVGDVYEYRGWTEAFGDEIIIRYHLDDTVELINVNTGEMVAGKREFVSTSAIGKNIFFLNDKEAFEQRRNQTISDNIDGVLQYCLANNNAYNPNDIRYSVNILNNQEDVEINSPTVLAFLQGNQLMKSDGDVLNVYAFSATGIMDKRHYFIDETKGRYYCFEELCENGLIECIDGLYFFDGNVIERLYTSMEECAKQGAYPGR
ncbi:MAG: hypothetical protein IJW18_02185 [Lachnospiraceae bacterium]|nr:hypothetical protein [Lachnospiraceae bacterium]